MTNEDLIKLGFKSIPHFTVENNVVFDINDHRSISAGCIGTPNEILFLCEHEYEDHSKITDCICIHNWDYDGYLTEEKITGLIKFLTMKNK